MENFEKKYLELLKEFEDFTYVISHDFKAPLRGIINLSDWIIDDFKEGNVDEIEPNLLIIKNRADRLDKMVDCLKLLSRVERYDIETSQFNLKIFVENLLKSLQEKFTNITFETVNLPNIDVNTYEKKLEFVLNEIITNAIIHPKNGTSITLNFENNDGELKIIVDDNTTSTETYPKEKLNEFFRIFYTSKNKNENDNFGAGLTICKKIVNFVKGELNLRQNEMGAIQVEIKWPIHT